MENPRRLLPPWSSDPRCFYRRAAWRKCEWWRPPILGSDRTDFRPGDSTGHGAGQSSTGPRGVLDPYSVAKRGALRHQVPLRGQGRDQKWADIGEHELGPTMTLRRQRVAQCAAGPWKANDEGRSKPRSESTSRGGLSFGGFSIRLKSQRIAGVGVSRALQLRFVPGGPSKSAKGGDAGR